MKISHKTKIREIYHPFHPNKVATIIRETTTVVYEILNKEGQWEPIEEGEIIHENQYLNCEDN